MMTIDSAVEIGQSAVMLVLTLGGPVLIAALAVGVVVSLLQAMTQLQDVTIGFVPRLLVTLATLACLWPWMCERMVDYTTALYRDVPGTL